MDRGAYGRKHPSVAETLWLFFLVFPLKGEHYLLNVRLRLMVQEGTKELDWSDLYDALVCPVTHVLSSTHLHLCTSRNKVRCRAVSVFVEFTTTLEVLNHLALPLLSPRRLVREASAIDPD